MFPSTWERGRPRPQSIDPSETGTPLPCLAVDLHTHSRYAGGASPALILEKIIPQALHQGIDVLGTGDCLQPAWLREIETKLQETGTGMLIPRTDFDAACRQVLPYRFRRPLRFVLSTEVCCAPQRRFGGLHHLLFFSSIERVRRFQQRVARFGYLDDGRPTFRLSSRELLEVVLEHGDGCALAPAHVLSPWFSLLGSVHGKPSPHEIFGELEEHLLAVEAGLPATPAMCRRISALDRHALFCCSDAHRVENIGREYTLFEIEPSYHALIHALRHPEHRRIRGYVKFPVLHTGYYWNWCSACDEPCDALQCPACGGPIAVGTRDRVAVIADRPGATPCLGPKCHQRLPLLRVVSWLMNVGPTSARVRRVHTQLLDRVGPERYVLMEAPEEELAEATTRDLAHAIVRQRACSLNVRREQQMSFGW